MRRILACIQCGCMLDPGEQKAGLCPRCRLTQSAAAPAEKPAEPEIPPAPEIKKNPPAAPQKTKRRILIADDDAVFRKFIANRLTAEGFVILTARDGQEAFETAVREKPDLVLIDVLLPRLTGYDLVHKLHKQTDGSQHIPILILTAKRSMKKFFSEWEIHGFMTKPIDPAEVTAKIRELIETAEFAREKRGGGLRP